MTKEKEAIELLKECEKAFLSCGNCPNVRLDPFNLVPFRLGFRIATFLKDEDAPESAVTSDNK